MVAETQDESDATGWNSVHHNVFEYPFNSRVDLVLGYGPVVNEDGIQPVIRNVPDVFAANCLKWALLCSLVTSWVI